LSVGWTTSIWTEILSSNQFNPDDRPPLWLTPRLLNHPPSVHSFEIISGCDTLTFFAHFTLHYVYVFSISYRIRYSRHALCSYSLDTLTNESELNREEGLRPKPPLKTSVHFQATGSHPYGDDCQWPNISQKKRIQERMESKSNADKAIRS